LRELRPAIRTPARIFEWWDRLLDPVLEAVGQEKGLAREVVNSTLDLLSIDEHDETTNLADAGLSPLTDRLLSRWMSDRASQTNQSSSVDFKERLIKDALMAFGKKDPKGFMTCLDRYVIRREYRNAAFALLCDFVESQPPHLHLILQTPLFINVMHSLQYDESTSTVTMALVSLIMLLPNIPSSLVPFLPTLFNIYARLLFWDRDTYFAQEHTEISIIESEGKTELTWEKCLLDPDHDGSSIPYLSTYFTILYGLYPINFLDYIRKPQRYLRHANNTEDIDVQATEIRERSERYRKHHVLHKNFYHLTIESEKTDMSRWINSEADEVLADCMGLSIQSEADAANERSSTPLPGMPGSVLGGEGDRALLANSLGDASSLRNSSHISLGLSQETMSGEVLSLRRVSRDERRDSQQSSHPSLRDSLGPDTRDGAGSDSPTLPPQLTHSSSHAQLHEVFNSSKAIVSGIQQSHANDSVPSLNLDPAPEVLAMDKTSAPVLIPPRSGTPGASSSILGGVELGAEHASILYRQNVLLQNDLQFERYIKQQHMTHMGELRRKQIREAATEAETQNLVMANRSLKQRLDEAKRGEIQIKREFDRRRNIAKKWESDLTAKLKALQTKQKTWQSEEEALRQRLEEAQKECMRLRKIVGDLEEKRLKFEQSLEAIDISTEEIARLKAEIIELSSVKQEYNGKQLQMEKAMRDAEAAENRALELKMQLTAMEAQLEKERRSHSERECELTQKLTKASLREPDLQSDGRRRVDVIGTFQAALETSRAKQAELQKQYSALMKKYTALQSQLLDLQCDQAAAAAPERKDTTGLGTTPGSVPLSLDTDMESPTTTHLSRSPIAIRNRASPRERGFSDPEDRERFAIEGVSHNATPPLDPISTSSGSYHPQHLHRHAHHSSPLSPGSGGPGSGTTGSGAGGGAGGSSFAGSSSPTAERYHGRGETYSN